MSWLRRMNCLVFSMAALTLAGSGLSNRSSLPMPTKVTPLSANRLRTFSRPASSRSGSTLWACVVRSSTPSTPVFLQFLRSVGRSQSAPHMYVTRPNEMAGGSSAAKLVLESAEAAAAPAASAAEVERKSRRVVSDMERLLESRVPIPGCYLTTEIWQSGGGSPTLAVSNDTFPFPLRPRRYSHVQNSPDRPVPHLRRRSPLRRRREREGP